MADRPADPSGKCSCPAAAEGYAEITAEQAHALLEAGGVSLLDVRTATEFADGHIEGALNCPSELIFTYRTLPFTLDHSLPLLIYCRSGRRARDVGPLLTAMGFAQVLNFGGVLNWKYGLIQSASPTPSTHHAAK